jgi:hypothetical protein
MAYYRGDYYRGDYYRGDPGLFGDIWKGIKKVGGAVVGATPIGAAVKSGMKLISGGSPGPAAGSLPMIAPPQVPSGYGIQVGGPSGFQFGAFPQYPPGGVPPDISSGQVPMVIGGRLCMVKGTRANKSTYITRGGGTSKWPRQLIVHPKGTECVKPRRLNVANPRALRRAIRRAQGFSKLARRVMSFVGRAPKGRAIFKRKRRG